jgi:hypothetical protein
MNIDDFQQHALKSIAITDKGPAALAHRALGLSGEAGILNNQLKKIIRDKNSIPDEEDIEVVKKRLGDILYYAAAMADYFDLSLTDIAKQNMVQSATFQQNHEKTNS